MSEHREPSVLRYPLAVLACAVTVCIWVPILIGAGWLIFTFLDGWVDRQVWLIRVALQCILGLVLLAILGVGCGFTSETWTRITQPRGSRATGGQKHGRHSKWRPGYDPSAEPTGGQTGEGDGAHGRCPKCEFNYFWNGTRCGHCGYSAE